MVCLLLLDCGPDCAGADAGGGITCLWRGAHGYVGFEISKERSMASSTQKKTTTKKSGGRFGSRGTKSKQPQKRPIRREVGGAVLLVLALCVLVSYCGVQAILIDLLAELLKGLLGYGYWLAGPAMLLAGLILLLHRGRPVALRTTCALLLPVLAGALFHTLLAAKDYALNSAGVLKELWAAGLASILKSFNYCFIHVPLCHFCHN